jgi:hypothetical protein
VNEENMMKKAMRPIEKNRRTRSKPAKIRHLQKQQKLWMVSKVEWRKPGTKPGLAPSSLLLRTTLTPRDSLCAIDLRSRRAA